jgi:Pyruvate/2-oxoacid:ferredoxin oxidoreductase delta subunit
MFAGESCNGCGLCAKHCPNLAIRMLGTEQRPYWTFRCEQCMRCAGYCPQKAVDCNSLIVVSFIAMFAAIPLEKILTRAIFSLLPHLGGFGQTITVYFLYYVIVLLLAAGIYFVFYLLSRISSVNRIMTRLSFTHYWRKYRQADVPIDTLIKH